MSEHDLLAILHSIDQMSPEQQKVVYDHIANKVAAEQRNERLFKQKLLEAGLLREIRPPVKDPSVYQNRKLAKVTGKPVSETVIEERR